MIAGYQRTVARGEFSVAVESRVEVTKLYQYSYGWALALAPAGPSTPANWLPYILLILPLPLRFLPFPFTTTQRSRFSLLFSSPSRVDLTVDHAPAVSVSFCLLPATPRSATPSLDVNPRF